MSGSRRIVAGAAVLLLPVLAGCAGGPTADPIEAPAVATFLVAGEEEYRIELVTDELVEHVVGLQNGGEDGRIPVGRIVRDGDGGVNSPWSWHIDPDSLEFADFTTEVCDGLPSFVEDETLTSDTYCPWLTEVVGIEPLD
ncbi:hypothetical protein [Herbiconiux sp. L3-i23]|uniref:BP74-related protein n=1 Tax=Herbiconiux sp. L3-i23 TaxID=2905871 RepID=UPI0020745886|nr:hypothetical protein [Herbiconiux sp. L3-i23]